MLIGYLSLANAIDRKETYFERAQYVVDPWPSMDRYNKLILYFYSFIELQLN